MKKSDGSVLPFDTIELDGIEYKSTTLTFEKWVELVELLGQFVGDPLRGLLSGDNILPEGVTSIDASMLIRPLIELVTKLRASDLMKLAGIMAYSLTANNSQLNKKKQDLWWPAHMSHLIPVTILFLEVQFSDFFSGISDSPLNIGGSLPFQGRTGSDS
jgi:hypothetical protein